MAVTHTTQDQKNNLQPKPLDEKLPLGVTIIDPQLDPKVETRIKKYYGGAPVNLAEELTRLHRNDEKRFSDSVLEEYDDCFTLLHDEMYCSDMTKEEKENFSKKIKLLEKKFKKNPEQLTSSEFILLTFAYSRAKNAIKYDEAKLKKYSSYLELHSVANPFCSARLGYLYYKNELWNPDQSSPAVKRYHQAAKAGVIWATYELLFLVIFDKHVAAEVNLLKTYFEKVIGSGKHLVAEYFINYLFQEKLQIPREELIRYLALYKKLTFISQGEKKYTRTDKFPNCGLTYNAQTNQVEFNQNAFDQWLLKQGLTARGVDKPVTEWKDLKPKMLLLITTDIHFFMGAIASAIESYTLVHRDSDGELNEHQQNIILFAKNLEKGFHDFLNNEISRLELIDAIEHFFKESGGGIYAENSMKYLIMEELLRRYTGDQFNNAKPNNFITRSRFISQMNEMVELARDFVLNFTSPFQLEPQVIQRANVQEKPIVFSPAPDQKNVSAATYAIMPQNVGIAQSSLSTTAASTVGVTTLTPAKVLGEYEYNGARHVVVESSSPMVPASLTARVYPTLPTRGTPLSSQVSVITDEKTVMPSATVATSSSAATTVAASSDPVSNAAVLSDAALLPSHVLPDKLSFGNSTPLVEAGSSSAFVLNMLSSEDHDAMNDAAVAFQNEMQQPDNEVSSEGIELLPVIPPLARDMTVLGSSSNKSVSLTESSSGKPKQNAFQDKRRKVVL